MSHRRGQAPARFGECMCGAAASREPLNDPASVRTTPVRISIAFRRRFGLRALLCYLAGYGGWAPNNRLQWMRGLAYF